MQAAIECQYGRTLLNLGFKRKRINSDFYNIFLVFFLSILFSQQPIHRYSIYHTLYSNACLLLSPQQTVYKFLEDRDLIISILYLHVLSNIVSSSVDRRDLCLFYSNVLSALGTLFLRLQRCKKFQVPHQGQQNGIGVRT